LQGNKRSPFDGKVDLEGNKIDTVIQKILTRLSGGHLESSNPIAGAYNNDEAHHCYLPKSKVRQRTMKKLTRTRGAAVWFTGLRKSLKKFKLQSVYDLSATPYFCRFRL